MNTRFFDSTSSAETKAFGAEISRDLKAGDVLLLKGDLGAGKTCLVSGIALGLGSHEEATSPTFTLINEYHGGRLPLYHVDLYRLEGRSALQGLGLEEYFWGEGVCAVEWPERMDDPPPPGSIWILLEHRGESTRHVEVHWP